MFCERVDRNSDLVENSVMPVGRPFFAVFPILTNRSSYCGLHSWLAKVKTAFRGIHPSKIASPALSAADVLWYKGCSDSLKLNAGVHKAILLLRNHDNYVVVVL